MSIWLIGHGNMGGAMLSRWMAAGVDPASLTVVDPFAASAPDGVRLLREAPQGSPETLILAIKPQQLAALAAGPLGATEPTRVISILAGVTTATLAAHWPQAMVVRAMPNLPVAIGKGVVALYAGGAHDRVAAELMAPLGLVEWIGDEALFDAVTALSGCGPGFVFRFIDALAAAGAALGLPVDQAERLAVATVEGSGLMAAASRETAAVLADRVASPGGSTREGLNVLDRDDALRRLLAETLAAAAARNAELAKGG